MEMNVSDIMMSVIFYLCIWKMLLFKATCIAFYQFMHFMGLEPITIASAIHYSLRNRKAYKVIHICTKQVHVSMTSRAFATEITHTHTHTHSAVV